MTRKQSLRYHSGDNLTPSEFSAWWGVLNAELSVRGLEHARYGIARRSFGSGLTPSHAADLLARVES